MDIEEYLKKNKVNMDNIFETLKTELEKLGFYLLESDTNCKGKEYEYMSWADFRMNKDGKEINISWHEPVDYSHSIKYSCGKDKWDTGFYNVNDIPELIEKIIQRINSVNESINNENLISKLNKAINEALQ